ncbi:MAG: hypothetical protein HQK76_09665 [Desulfobacterales bacterium]|nr:hypothetical protein [Desulfobacterales bacterium]
MNRLLKILLILAFIFFYGCFGTQHKYRGKLSDAMDKSSDTYEGERKISSAENSNGINSEVNSQEKQNETNLFTASESKELEHDTDDNFFVGFSGGSGILKGEDFLNINYFNASFGTYYDDYKRFELFAGMAWAPIKETSELNNSIENGVIMFNAGLAFKIFTTPRHTFLGQYFILGADYTLMFWTYKNDIKVDNDYISADNIEGIELFTGIGINFLQTNFFQIGGEILPSVIFWLPLTNEGFENDVFNPFLMIKFKINFTYYTR